jgi:protein-tyrosine phosphatase
MKHSVLFVCLGNICRSPLAEGVFRSELERRGATNLVRVDSCGTGGWHVGEGPDPRSVEVGLDHDVDIGAQRSRQLCSDDYQEFGWLVAMDGDNESVIKRRAPSGSSAKVVRMLDFHPGAGRRDVPDPYSGGPGGFETVYGLLEDAMPSLLDAVLTSEDGV